MLPRSPNGGPRSTGCGPCTNLADSMNRSRARRSTIPILGQLLARSGNLDDPNLPLMLWWGIEKHCDASRAELLAMLDDATIWEQPMVKREILPRTMRRFAVTGRERDLLTCAKLLRLAPGPSQREQLMIGFEQAFEGGSLPSLPEELLAAMAQGGELPLLLRVRQGVPDAIAEAVRLVADPKATPEERLRYVKIFGEIILWFLWSIDARLELLG